MAQEVEHFLGKEEVTGSNPVSSSSVFRSETMHLCGFRLFLFTNDADFLYLRHKAR